MDKRKTIIIKRISPPRPTKKKYNLDAIIKAAQKVREAVEREEKIYGKLGLA